MGAVWNWKYAQHQPWGAPTMDPQSLTPIAHMSIFFPHPASWPSVSLILSKTHSSRGRLWKTGLWSMVYNLGHSKRPNMAKTCATSRTLSFSDFVLFPRLCQPLCTVSFAKPLSLGLCSDPFGRWWHGITAFLCLLRRWLVSGRLRFPHGWQQRSSVGNIYCDSKW